MKHISLLSKLVQYHIIPLRLTLDDMRRVAVASENAPRPSQDETLQLPTASGHVLNVALSQDPTVEGVRIIEPNIEADNGVIHIIEHILWPPGLSEATFVRS